MKINGIEVKGIGVAYDGCHKLYILEDLEDVKQAKKLGYTIYDDVVYVEDLYVTSCELRFISNWKLDKTYVKQFEKAIFEE